jgi:hypothetical protein
MDYIKLEELKVGDIVWFNPFSISTKVDVLWPSYKLVPCSRPVQVKVTAINKYDVEINYLNGSLVPGEWEWRYGKCIEGGCCKQFSLKSILFKTKEDAQKAVSEVIDNYSSAVHAFSERVDSLQPRRIIEY